MTVVAIGALFVWVKFGLKVLLCVKRLAFYNSGRREVGTGGRLGRTWAGTGSGRGRPAATLSRTSCGSQVTRILILLLSLMSFLLSLLLPVFLHEPFLTPLLSQATRTTRITTTVWPSTTSTASLAVMKCASMKTHLYAKGSNFVRAAEKCATANPPT